MPGKDFAVLPWTRTVLASRAVAPAASGSHRRIQVGLQVSANGQDQGTPATTEVILLGAGEVTAIDPNAIARVEPTPGSRGVEPNYFPHVEFVDADFPWRYSLDVGSSPRVLPWFVLIALRSAEFTFAPVPPSGLPRIAVASPAASLPDLSQSWAWAHTQVSVVGSNASVPDVTSALAGDPAGHFARVLCARRLVENATYDLFLVPTFEAGRVRGLGLPDPANPWDALAWNASTPPGLLLPYYAHWQFSTSAAEDFESLVRRLGPVDLDASATSSTGGLRARGGETGYFGDYLDPARMFLAEGALQTLGAEPRREAFALDGLTPRLQTVLNATLAASASGVDGPDREDPLFTLPVYGRTFSRAPTVGPPTAPGGAWPGPLPWRSESNLDRRYRLAAGIGARAVRRHQEDFMRACWEQAGEIRKANRLLMQARLAKRTNERVVSRHLARLDPEVTLALASEQIDAIRGTGGLTLAAQIDRAGVPDGSLTLDERKIAAKRPDRSRIPTTASTRRSALGPADPLATVSATPDDALTRLESDRATRATAWRAALFSGARPETTNEVLVAAASPQSDAFSVQRLDFGALAAQLQNQISRVPELTLAQSIAGASVPSLDDDDLILRGPRIAEPTYRYLSEERAAYLLPGIGAVPFDSVGLLKLNRRFVEAYLLGMNDEMNRELLWREYPSDLRTTVFARFWDRGAPPEDQTVDDIAPVHTWKAALGGNAPAANVDNIVLIVRGSLPLRFPAFQIALNRQQLQGGPWRPDAGSDVPVSFWGALDRDTAFFGFALSALALRQAIDEYFFVIYEPPGRFRFGLDIANYATRSARQDLRRVSTPFARIGAPTTAKPAAALTRAPTPAPAAATSWDDLSWTHVDLTPGGYVSVASEIHVSRGDHGEWGAQRHAGSIASVTFQKPVRLIVPARRMLGAA